MLSDGLILGALTAAGFYLVYKRLPDWAKEFAAKHPLFVDVLVACCVYLLLGWTLTAHMAAAFAALLHPIMMILGRNERFCAWVKMIWQKGKEAWEKLLGLLEGKLAVVPTT